MKATYRTLVTALQGLLLLLAQPVYAQMGQANDPMHWSAKVAMSSDSTLLFQLRGLIDKDWHIYSMSTPTGGPMATTLRFLPSDHHTPLGELTEHGQLLTEFDEAFGVDVMMYGDSVRFEQQLLRRDTAAFTLSVDLSYQTCHAGQCYLFEHTEQVEVPAQSAMRPAAMAAVPPLTTTGRSVEITSAPQGLPAIDLGTTPTAATGRGWWGFLLISFLAGLAGLLTPCVFPMIPMTVSFFMQKKNRVNALLNALVFGIGIVLIYTLLGLLVSLAGLGADVVVDITSHWLTNTIFFLLFLLFAASFFGMFEMRLPGSLSNKTDAKADKGGFVGSFFLALTTVIVSLSCVGPIVGALLVEAASGDTLRPALGMFAFALGFSLPFTFFALFPQLLSKLPKSGGWLNSVKIVLGFIVLAFSLKFLLNIDVALGLGWLNRPVYLSIWIVLSVFLGLYLLGKIRFKFDSPLDHVGFIRMLLAGGAFVFAILLATGLLGASLAGLSGMLPTPNESSFSVSMAAPQQSSAPAVDVDNYPGLCDPPKYANLIQMPIGLEGYRDYKQALACAQKQNKPLLIEFSGHSCANCKEMAAKILSQPKVQQLIREQYIFVQLYVDERYELPEREWYTSTFDGKVKKTLGKQNQDLQMGRFATNALPTFVLLSPQEEQLAPTHGRDLDVESFLAFLRSGLK